MIDSRRGNRRSVAKKKRLRDARARRRRFGRPRVHSQAGGWDGGGGAFVKDYSTLTVADGSSIDDNSGYVSSPASLSLLGSLVDSPKGKSTLGR